MRRPGTTPGSFEPAGCRRCNMTGPSPVPRHRSKTTWPTFPISLGCWPWNLRCRGGLPGNSPPRFLTRQAGPHIKRPCLSAEALTGFYQVLRSGPPLWWTGLLPVCARSCPGWPGIVVITAGHLRIGRGRGRRRFLHFFEAKMQHGASFWRPVWRVGNRLRTGICGPKSQRSVAMLFDMRMQEREQ
jgi:hypothetical protein